MMNSMAWWSRNYSNGGLENYNINQKWLDALRKSYPNSIESYDEQNNGTLVLRKYWPLCFDVDDCDEDESSPESQIISS